MSVFLNEKIYFNDCAQKSTYDEMSSRENADESEVQHTLFTEIVDPTKRQQRLCLTASTCGYMFYLSMKTSEDITFW